MENQHVIQRRHPRYAAHAPVQLQTIHYYAPCATNAVDLSRDGMHVSLVHEALDIDEPVVINIHLGAAFGELKCKAKVAWADRGPDGMFHFGVHFENIAEADQAALIEFLSSKARVRAEGQSRRDHALH